MVFTLSIFAWYCSQPALTGCTVSCRKMLSMLLTSLLAMSKPMTRSKYLFLKLSSARKASSIGPTLKIFLKMFPMLDMVVFIFCSPWFAFVKSSVLPIFSNTLKPFWAVSSRFRPSFSCPRVSIVVFAFFSKS